MKRVLAVIRLAVPAVALWLFWPSVDAPRALEHDSAENVPPSSAAAPVETPGTPDSTRAAEEHGQAREPERLRVRSSAGIPLTFVELRGSAEWQRVELDDGGCDPGSRVLPFEMRAPGHVGRRVESLAGEVLLEPDALMVIRSATLRTCLERVVADEAICRTKSEFHDARERAISHGWISEREYGVAWAYDRLEPLPREQDLLAVRSDGREFHLMLAEHPGLRASWELPCGDLAKHSALEVKVRRASPERGPLRLVLVCAAIDLPAGLPPEFDFGMVARTSTDVYQELELAPEADEARFDCALVGRRHVLAAIDTSTHAYGRCVFVHDGSVRTLEMREPLEIRARALDAQTRAPLGVYSALIRASGETGWILEVHDQATGKDGSMRMIGPARPLANESMPLDPPAHWSACFASPGYEDLRMEFDLATPHSSDLGELLLQRRENSIVLAPGSGIAAKDLDGQYVAFADDPNIGWGTRAGVVLPDGGLEVELSRMEGTSHMEHIDQAKDTETWVDFTRDLGARLMVRVPNDARTFQLGSDGRYHAVPEDSLDLTLRTESLPADGKSWQIGWSWDGAWMCVGQLASRVAGNEKNVRITVPRGALKLWWSSTGIPPELHGDPGGSAPIQDAAPRLVLR